MMILNNYVIYLFTDDVTFVVNQILSNNIYDFNMNIVNCDNIEILSDNDN